MGASLPAIAWAAHQEKTEGTALLLDGLAVLLALCAMALPFVTQHAVRIGQLLLGAGIVAISTGALVLPWLIEPGAPPPVSFSASNSSLELGLWGLALLLSQWPNVRPRAVTAINFLLITALSLAALELASNLVEREFTYLLIGLTWNDLIATAVAGLCFMLWRSFHHADWHQAQQKNKNAHDILLLSGSILFFLVLTSGIAGFMTMANTTKSVLTHMVQTSLAGRTQVLETTIERTLENAKLTSEWPYLKSLLKKANDASLDAEEQQAISNILDSIIAGPNVTAATLYDANGRKLGQRGELLVKSDIQLPLTTKPGATLLWQNGSLLQTSLPILHEGKPVGRVALNIAIPLINQLFDEKSGVGSGSTLAICAPLGEMMDCLPNRSNKFTGYRGPRQVNGVPVPMHYAFEGKSGVSTGVDAQGQYILAAYSPVGNLGIGAVTKVRAEELYSPIRLRLKLIFALMIGLVFLGLLLIRWRLSPLVNALAEGTRNLKVAEDRLGHMSQHDSLTGLPNRATLIAHLDQLLIEAERHKRLLAVMFVDLDRFKYINDSLGHEQGDALLRAVAARLEICLRPGDILSRQGGDEFTLVFANIAHENDVNVLAERVQEHLLKPFFLIGNELVVTASIGIALHPADGSSSDALLKSADIAAYRAKDQGRNTYQFFKPELQDKAEHHVKLQQDLRRAIEQNELFLVYQPVVDLHTGRITSAEALIRWKHGVRGFVSPLDFIPLAEETGLILPIGEWVLRTACRQIKQWQAAGLPKIRVAVNLSARQLAQANIVSIVTRILGECAVSAKYLGLELTESTLVHSADAAKATLDQLAGLGIHISIDDFGTGYSSLSYLQRFPVDTLKIDRSFVQHLPDNADNNAIASAIVTLAHALQMSVVAEGVETGAQQSFLRGIGCESMQGYLFSKPISAEEFAALLARNAAEALVA